MMCCAESMEDQGQTSMQAHIRQAPDIVTKFRFAMRGNLPQWGSHPYSICSAPFGISQRDGMGSFFSYDTLFFAHPTFPYSVCVCM